MQIRIKNFGPIKSLDLDLNKKFTLIFGKNNIGKSYATSAAYLILKNLLKIGYENLDASLTEFGESLRESFYATYEDLGNLRSRFSEKGMKLFLCTDPFEIAIESHGKNLLLHKNSVPANKTTTHPDIRHIHYLPASRSGLYQALSAFSQIFAELSRSRGILKKKIDIPSIPEPVSDYFLGLSAIRTRAPGTDNEILCIVRETEKNILKGEVLFDEETKRMVFLPRQTGLRLDMSLTSSMVSELSPVISYLKYLVAFADGISLIFIEEPESHLHPEAQIRLMEIFAKLVTANVRIVLTSHSSHMFNKMNNLILDKKIDPDTTGTVVFKETDEGGVGTYISTDELGADDENFLEVTEKLFSEKLELIEKLNSGGIKE
ncbi:AAA family ATPase [Desulfococcaceae bacterium HSG8]|nr:AAA family ATPase [Desulfococcaceae bacterium HSG8]